MEARLRHLRNARDQSGAVTLAIAAIIFALILAALVSSLSMTGAGVVDSALQERQLRALYAAEAGVERAAYRFLVGDPTKAACGSTVDESAPPVIDSETSYSISSSSGSTSSCVFKVTGVSANVQRTLQVGLGSSSNGKKGSQGAGGQPSLQIDIQPGSNLMVVAGISFRSDTAATVSSMKLCSACGATCTAMACPSPTGTVDGTGQGCFVLLSEKSQINGTVNVKTQAWRILVGTATANTKWLCATATGSPRTIFGALQLSGVDQSNPIVEFVNFSNADTNVVDGATLTQGTSNATIGKVVVLTGTLASGINTGRLSLWRNSQTGDFTAGAATTSGSGALTLSGAQTTAITNGGTVASGNTIATVSVTNANAGNYLVDVVGLEGVPSGSVTMDTPTDGVASTDRTEAWNVRNTAGGPTSRVQGAASYRGEIVNAGSTATMSWTGNNPVTWASIGLAVRAASTGDSAYRKVRPSGQGAHGWTEVVVAQ
jgi:hypothetical protein